MVAAGTVCLLTALAWPHAMHNARQGLRAVATADAGPAKLFDRQLVLGVST